MFLCRHHSTRILLQNILPEKTPFRHRGYNSELIFIHPNKRHYHHYGEEDQIAKFRGGVEYNRLIESEESQCKFQIDTTAQISEITRKQDKLEKRIQEEFEKNAATSFNRFWASCSLQLICVGHVFSSLL